MQLIRTFLSNGDSGDGDSGLVSLQGVTVILFPNSPGKQQCNHIVCSAYAIVIQWNASQSPGVYGVKLFRTVHVGIVHHYFGCRFILHTIFL